MRAVIDTNVLISAIFWTGRPKQLLNQVRRREVTFLTSELLLTELKEVLIRGDKPFKLSEKEAERVITTIRDLAEIILTNSRVAVCRDETDNRVLECAIDGQADWIINGDRDLLGLQTFHGVKIVTVGEFLKLAGWASGGS